MPPSIPTRQGPPQGVGPEAVYVIGRIAEMVKTYAAVQLIAAVTQTHSAMNSDLIDAQTHSAMNSDLIDAHALACKHLKEVFR